MFVAQVSLIQGRDMRFAPDWNCSEASVVFDRNSGDYWIVSLLASMALKCLQTHGAMDIAELERHLEPSRLYADLHAALRLTMESLVDNVLVQIAEWPAP